MALPKKSALRSDPRHVANPSLERNPPIATTKQNSENFAPTNSPDPKDRAQSHKTASSFDFTCNLGQFNSYARTKPRDDSPKHGDKDQFYTLKGSKSSRILANITNNIDKCNKTTRDQNDSSDSYSEDTHDNRFRTLTEGFDPQFQYKPKSTTPTSFQPRLTLKAPQTDGGGPPEYRKTVKESDFDKIFNLTEREDDKSSDIDSYNMNDALAKNTSPTQERFKTAYQGTIKGDKREAEKQLKYYNQAEEPFRYGNQNKKDYLNKTEIIDTRGSETSSTCASLDIDQHQRKTYKEQGRGKRSHGEEEDLRLRFERQISDSTPKSSNLENQIFSLEKEIVSLRGELHQLREENKALKRRQMEFSSKERDEYEAKILKIEREKIDLIQENTELKEELDDTRRGFQLKLQNFTNIITGLYEEIQLLQSQSKPSPEHIRSYTEKKVCDETSREKRGVRSAKSKGREANNSETNSAADGELYAEHQASMKDLEQYRKSTSKFVDCITDLIIECSPSNAYGGGKPSLKECWKWIKNMVRDYMTIKKRNDNLNESEQIAKFCAESLMINDKKAIVPTLYQMQMQQKRFEQIIGKVKAWQDLPTVEALEEFLEKQLLAKGSCKTLKN